MIPLKIETLLEGRVVEHDRVEYKTGWNPNDIIHSICAFANDYDNSNGGYIVIGVKEENGMPVFPLAGVQKEELDSIQQEIFQYCNMIVPRYIPRMEIVNYKNSETSIRSGMNFFIREYRMRTNKRRTNKCHLSIQKSV